MTGAASIISVKSLAKTYADGMVEALKGVNIEVANGEFLCLMGHSGSGKSTLLHIMGTLDDPTAGELLIGGKYPGELGPLPLYRAANIGFVFQFHHLLPAMTVSENVEAPMVPLGIPREERRSRASSMLGSLGLGERLDFLPSRISGGERQRAAIARALVNSPRIVFADEPTGHLDEDTTGKVMSFLIGHCKAEGATLILATHNPELAKLADRVLVLRSGVLVQE